MGVPISFGYLLNTEQFDLLGISREEDKSEFTNSIRLVENAGCCILSGRRLYARLFIRRKI